MMLSDVCLSDVCLVGPKSRTQRPRKTKIGTKVAHVTRDSVHFQGQKVKGQGHREHIVAVSRLRLVISGSNCPFSARPVAVIRLPLQSSYIPNSDALRVYFLSSS